MAQKRPISAIILAGGQARRFNGVEKGLQPLGGKPLIAHIIERLAPQVCNISLNINRLQSEYARLFPEIPTYCDHRQGFQGPLSGMCSGLVQAECEYVLFVPCDSPFLPANLAQKLWTALQINQADIAYAHDGERPHPTFALLHRRLATPLAAYLAKGERRVLDFFRTQASIAVDFSEQPHRFQNFNTADDLACGQRFPSFSHIPLLAITGYSGTGKTTLLEKLIPQLNARGLKVGLIKHSHHHIETDKPGKDSHRLRLAGANPTMVACDQRWALMCETTQPPTFAELLAQFDGQGLDLILVEGFKHEGLPKIQLHRQALNKPLPPLDDFTLATATDYPLDRENHLNINHIEQITEFVLAYLNTHPLTHRHKK